jgi:hypothetical protein
MNRLRNNLRNIKENNIVSFIFDDRFVHESWEINIYLIK